MAVHAVCSERVSEGNSLLNREFTGKQAALRPALCKFNRETAVNLGRERQEDWILEQGIHLAE